MNELTERFIADHQILLRLAIALSLGLLIGLQRGWVDRERLSGERIAGIRTHALIGLLGGGCAILAQHLNAWMVGFGLLAVTMLAVTAYREQLQRTGDFSITGTVGLLLTFIFGALAILDDPVIAAAAAVATAILLDNKQEIHSFVRRLQDQELDAGLKLLLISVVMLPLLPNQGMGPGGVINPYQLWWMVVLIAGISFVGYFAVRIGGTEKGILFTSLFAGLSSSTALTLHFSRLSRSNPELSPLLAAGILVACATMFPRILLICLLLNPELAQTMAGPGAAMAGLLYIPALIIWHRHSGSKVDYPPMQQNPLELKSALFFGLILLLIMVLAHLLKAGFGDAGLVLLAALSGLTDVDAVTLSVARLSTQDLSLSTAILAIIVAASVNNAVKTGMTLIIGHRNLGLRVALPMLAAILCGLLAAILI